MTESITPPHLFDVWPDANWDNRALWALDVPIQSFSVDALVWLLDHPVWSSRPPEPLFDLCPRDVLAEPGSHLEHARRIRDADVGLPLIVHLHRGRHVVLDGVHRLARALQDGVGVLPGKTVTRAQLLASVDGAPGS